MKKSLLFAVLLLLVAASPAAAALNEYYTYGGFSPVTIAFSNVASIFADGTYKGAITTFAVLGLFFAGAGGFMNMISGKGGPLGWAVPFLTGIVIYLSLYTPTTNLAVYDPVYNQNKVIAGLPVGVVYTAGLINHLERFVVDVFDTNATLPPNTACGPLSPMQYAEMGGAVGMRLMQSSTSQYIEDANASASLTAYINDCVQFEMTRPGSTLTLNNLLTPGCGQTTLGVMGQASSNANYTTDYFVTPSAAISCAAAYTKITNFYTSAANANQPVSNACGGTSFTDQARCQQIFTDMLQGTTGESIPATSFVGNNTVASITNNTLLNGGGSATTQYMTMLNQAQTGQSSGFMAGIMNPYMIDAYVAYTIMLMPILALFLVTPLWKNAFMLTISLVAWTCLLRSLDVITFHQWVVQFQQATAAALNNSGSGLDAAMRLPTLSNQYLGSFASMRNSVFLLATAVSGALFKFGDSAMSRLADKASASHDGIKEAVADRGVAAQKAMSNAAGAARAQMLTALAGGAHGWQNIGGGIAANEMASAAAGAGALSAFGGNAAGMMSGMEQNSRINTAQTSARAANLSESQAAGMGVNQAASEAAVLSKLGSDGKLAGWMAGMQTDKNIGETKGFQAAYKDAQASGYNGSLQDFAKDMSRYGTEKNFTDTQGFQNLVDEKFGGNRTGALQALTDVAAFQQAKHSAEVDETKAGIGKGAVGSGGAVGTAAGHNNLMALASDSVRRAVAEDNATAAIKNDPRLYSQGHFTEAGQEKLAALEAKQKQEQGDLFAHGKPDANAIKALHDKHATEKDALKKDPALYQTGHLTEQGYATVMGNMAGAAAPKTAVTGSAIGVSERSVVKDKDGHTLTQLEKGSVADQKQMHALAEELRGGGFKNAADEIDQMAKAGKGFNFDLSRDGAGHITGFHAEGGATAALNDKAREESGISTLRDNSHKTLSGTSSVADNSHKDLSGSSSIRDDSHKKVSGTSSVRDDSHRTLAGTSSVVDDSHKKLSGSSSVTDDSHKTFSGTSSVKDNSHKSLAGTASVYDASNKTITGTSSVDDNSHRSTDLIETVTGKVSTDNRNAKIVHAGTQKTGTGTELVGKAARALGADETTANYFEEAGATVGDLYKNTVAPIANEVAGARNAARVATKEREALQEKGLPVPEGPIKKGVTWAKGKVNPEVRRDEVGRAVHRNPSKAPNAPPKAPAPEPANPPSPTQRTTLNMENSSASGNRAGSIDNAASSKPSLQANHAESPMSRPSGSTGTVDMGNTAPTGPNRAGSIDNAAPRPLQKAGNPKPGGSGTTGSAKPGGNATTVKPGGGNKTWTPKG